MILHLIKHRIIQRRIVSIGFISLSMRKSIVNGVRYLAKLNNYFFPIVIEYQLNEFTLPTGRVYVRRLL